MSTRLIATVVFLQKGVLETNVSGHNYGARNRLDHKNSLKITVEMKVIKLPCKRRKKAPNKIRS